MLLLIDLATLRPNPNYKPGHATYYLPGPATWTRTKIRQLDDGWAKDEFIAYKQEGPWTLVDERTIRPKKPGDPIPACPEDWVNKIGCVQAVQEIYDLGPCPTHLFSYEDPVITTACCEVQLKVSELETDSWEDPESYGYTTTKCPKCGDWEAVTLTRESLTDALKRQQALAANNLAASQTSS